MKLCDHTKARIYKALKEAGHWYIVGVKHPWEHPANVVKNCLAIVFDGGIQWKFSVLDNGRLKVSEVRSRLYLDLPFKESDVITIKEFITQILANPFDGGMGVLNAGTVQAIMFDDSPSAQKP